MHPIHVTHPERQKQQAMQAEGWANATASEGQCRHCTTGGTWTSHMPVCHVQTIRDQQGSPGPKQEVLVKPQRHHGVGKMGVLRVKQGSNMG